MKDDPIKICPNCGEAVKRLLYPVGIVFKGTGWYVNDSRKPDTADSADAAKTDTKETESKGADTKPDSKSETKTETKVENKPEAAPAASPAS